MIYSNDFVWLHFPKCAGTKIEKIFEKYFSDDARICQDVVDPGADHEAKWHDSIRQREQRMAGFELGERRIICSFRKLPSWLESRYNFECQRSPGLEHIPELLLEGRFFEQGGFLNHADNYINKYLPEELLQSDKLVFIRTENFEHDFKVVFDGIVDIARIPSWEFAKKENSSTGCLPPEIKEQLYSNQDSLYRCCPHWRMIEEIAYASNSV